ncbi:hypothetical protein WUBG_16278, partial [Wuchereria bancrofti]
DFSNQPKWFSFWFSLCGLEDGFWEGFEWTEGVGAQPEQYRIVSFSNDGDNHCDVDDMT